MMIVELSTGVLIDGTPVGAGMRIECPADVGGYLVERGWARKVGAAHNVVGGRKLLALSARDIPGADQSFSEWSSWMRPEWVRPDGRAVVSGDERFWLPVCCPGCQRYGYAPKEKLPDDARRDKDSDARPIWCKRCR
ncbi:hypothetical protein GCM10023329_44230 [Streptomyces sanyensis]|uniref:Uncharacterized protein n=1 Tax=Streptomyces sanyensis TaxID=568869 RepID=A0ABP9B264_9ACTN